MRKRRRICGAGDTVGRVLRDMANYLSQMRYSSKVDGIDQYTDVFKPICHRFNT